MTIGQRHPHALRGAEYLELVASHSWLELIISLKLNPAKIKAFQRERIGFGLAYLEELLLILIGFGEKLPLMRGVFAAQIVPKEYRGLPPRGAKGYSLQLSLIDADNGTIQGLRQIVLGAALSDLLNAAIQDQLQKPMTPERYQQLGKALMMRPLHELLAKAETALLE